MIPAVLALRWTGLESTLCLTLEAKSLNSKKNLGVAPNVKQENCMYMPEFLGHTVSFYVPYIICGRVHVHSVSLFQDIFPHIPAKYFITATKEAH